jgi:hypothetical protein
MIEITKYEELTPEIREKLELYIQGELTCRAFPGNYQGFKK